MGMMVRCSQISGYIVYLIQYRGQKSDYHYRLQVIFKLQATRQIVGGLEFWVRMNSVIKRNIF